MALKLSAPPPVNSERFGDWLSDFYRQVKAELGVTIDTTESLTPTQATDLTDGGDSSLHYHAEDRKRSNHTGTQTSQTISDFESRVRSLSTGTDHSQLFSLAWTQSGHTGTAYATPVFNSSGAVSEFLPTTGSVVFAGANGELAQDNSNLFWDNANNRLGIGTSSPAQTLHIAGVDRVSQSGAVRYRSDRYFAGGTLFINSYDDTGAVFMPIQLNCSSFQFITGSAGNITTLGCTNGLVLVGTVVDDTVSALQVGGAIRATGVYKGGDGTSVAPALAFNSDTNSGFFRWNTGSVAYSQSGTVTLGFSNSEVRLGSATSLSWSSGAPNVAGGDTFVARDAAYALGQRNSTNAQKFRVYHTYTDASNYQRAAIQTGSDYVELAAETAGTGADNIDVRLTPAGTGAVSSVSPIVVKTANDAQWIRGSASESITLSTSGTTTDSSANLLPANSIIESVVARVTTTITTATDWQLGDPTTAGRFTAPNSTLVAGTTDVGLVHIDQSAAAGPRQTAAAKVRITTTGTPGAGVIRVTVFYRQFVAPTS
jgi:hypothetical protein